MFPFCKTLDGTVHSPSKPRLSSGERAPSSWPGISNFIPEKPQSKHLHTHVEMQKVYDLPTVSGPMWFPHPHSHPCPGFLSCLLSTSFFSTQHLLNYCMFYLRLFTISPHPHYIVSSKWAGTLTVLFPAVSRAPGIELAHGVLSWRKCVPSEWKKK